MIYTKYSDRIRVKLENLAKIYADMAFVKAGELENAEFIDTAEHFRSVPAGNAGWKKLEPGRGWGGEWMNMWIRGTVTVGENYVGRQLWCVPRVNAAEILYFLDGVPRGLFNSRGDYLSGRHSAQLICRDASPGEKHKIALECYAGHFVTGTAPYSSYGQDDARAGDFVRRFEGVDICVADETVRSFCYDLRAVMQMASVLDDRNTLKAKAQKALEAVFADVIQYPLHYSAEEIHSSLEKCLAHLAVPLAKGESDGTRAKVGMVGQSHMDTAWLWPVSETVRKCARTYSNVLSLMERYPDYTFVQSSALHLDWMRRYYPDIFKGIKKMTAEGRYEPNGGVWVECDCNITSGESMIRQFLHGQLFTRKYLGYESDTFWLPDTFGYNAAIPQIMLGCGVKYFFTTKISWNDLTVFPLDTFIWRGLDGSEVLSHFSTINSLCDVATVERAASSIRFREVTDRRLLPFGYGDGGGGPTANMLEDAKRVANVPGLPETYMTTVSAFMKSLESDREALPVYSGELYLELHRGTLTQMHDIKRLNRKSEFALRDAEYLNVLTRSPRCEKLDRLYETLLLNQFHDILPGSSIACVNDKAREELSALLSETKALASDYAASLTDGDAGALTLINTLPFERSDTFYIESLGVHVPDGASSQCFTDVCGRNVTALGGFTLHGFGSRSFELTDVQPERTASPFKAEGDILVTPFAEVAFDGNGFISSLVDTASGRELRGPGDPLNTFITGEDVPRSNDDWDIDFETELKLSGRAELVSRETVSSGALEYRVRSVYRFGHASSLKQDMVFHSDTPRVDFHTVIDWNEKHFLLKARFCLDIQAPTMKNEIQYGHIDRPTTRNTPAEAAKFEVANHKWTDISENRFGVALLNDCKYGVSAREGELSLTLHRGGTRPDVTGDRGVHELTYSLLPHVGAFSSENVVLPSYVLNIPVVTAAGRLTCEPEPPVRCDRPNIICEAVKPAESGENAYVVRLYECERNKTRCRLTFPRYVKRAFVTNMLEDKQSELVIDSEGGAELTFGPFKIVTLLLERE